MKNHNFNSRLIKTVSEQKIENKIILQKRTA